MNESQYIPLLAAFAGAVIGSITSIATIYLQQRAQSRRERASQIYNAALEHFKLAIEFVKINRKATNIPPFATFLHHQSQLFELLENGNLNAEALKELSAEQEKIEQLYRESLNKEPNQMLRSGTDRLKCESASSKFERV